MNIVRAIQLDIVTQDFQQALECAAADQWDLAIHHGEQGVQKLREFKATEQTEPAQPPTQKTLDV